MNKKTRATCKTSFHGSYLELEIIFKNKQTNTLKHYPNCMLNNILYCAWNFHQWSALTWTNLNISSWSICLTVSDVFSFSSVGTSLLMSSFFAQIEVLEITLDILDTAAREGWPWLTEISMLLKNRMKRTKLLKTLTVQKTYSRLS